MGALARGGVLALGLSACTLLTPVDGLTGGSTDGGVVTSGTDATAEGSAGDATLDALGPSDAGSGADGDAEAGAACGSAGPTQGLLAYYPFDEATGNTVHDCGPNHIDGTFVRQAAGGSWATGKRGGAIRVAAPNGCVDLGTPTQLQSPTMTIAMWANIAAYPMAGASGYLIGQAINADSAGWRLASRSTSVVGWEHTANSQSYYVDAPWPALNTWHHVTVTFKPNDTVQVFVDGTSGASQNTLPPINFVAVSLRIGCRADDANYFNGMIDELRIYDRVLTSAEITALAVP